MSLEKKSLEKKHKSLIDRNFKSLVDVFITFVKLKKEFPDIEFEGKDNIKLSSDGFIDFVNINDQEMRKIKNEYIQLCQLPSDTDEFRSKKINIEFLDKEIEKWYDSEDYNKFITNNKKNYEEHFREKVLEPKDLKIFFENVKLECHYCGISEEKIKEMAKVNKFNTIRFYYNRGRSLEIDRKDPSLNYSVDNMVLCCYWCNNAKTDEFTEEEFKAIGSVINLIWKIRNCKKIDK